MLPLTIILSLALFFEMTAGPQWRRTTMLESLAQISCRRRCIHYVDRAKKSVSKLLSHNSLIRRPVSVPCSPLMSEKFQLINGWTLTFATTCTKTALDSWGLAMGGPKLWNALSSFYVLLILSPHSDLNLTLICFSFLALRKSTPDLSD